MSVQEAFNWDPVANNQFSGVASLKVCSGLTRVVIIPASEPIMVISLVYK